MRSSDTRRGLMRLANAVGRRSNRLRERMDIHLLRSSSHFDGDAYLRHNPGVVEAGLEPHVHFARHGARTGRLVGPAFDGTAYLERYPDVAASGIHPLIHYLRHGRDEGRQARPAAGPGPKDSTPIPPRRSSTRELRLGKPVVTTEPGRVTIRCDMGDAPALYVVHEGPEGALALVEPRAEPFVPIALLMAGATDRDLVLHDAIDPMFEVALRTSYMPLLGIMFGFEGLTMRSRTLNDRPLSRGHERGTADSALLFSGGVDSLYSLMRLRELGRSPRYLMNVNAGGHGRDRRLMRLRQKRVARVARSVGCATWTIDTNFHEVVSITHKYAHPFRTLPSAYASYGAVGNLILSTAIHYGFLSFDWLGRSPETAGATVTDSIAWERMPVTEIGYDKPRFEKIRAISHDELSYESLDVCVGNSYLTTAGPEDRANCGKCFKCAEVTLTLEHLGCLERFHSQFDLDLFAATREELIDVVTERGSLGDRALLARLRGTYSDESEHVPVPRPSWSLARGSDGSSTASDKDRTRTQRTPIRLYWYRHRDPDVRNIGDELSPWIVEAVSGRRVVWAPPESCDLVAIGSILQRVVRIEREAPVQVWGSGFIADAGPVSAKSMEVSTLRGPESARLLDLAGEVPYGDPALLAGVFLNERPLKRQVLGIVPHHVDLDHPLVEAWRSERPAVIISPRLPPRLFLSAIARCEFVLSSSLHGLIVADALGVPNRWLQLSDQVLGGGFKFRDHLGAMSRSVDPIELPPPGSADLEALNESAVSDVPAGLAEMRRELGRTFPLH